MRLGWPPRELAGDDGEPAGTAGKPILRALEGAELSDVVAVVARWFGGTKLGRGGLVRAYGGAVRAALESVTTELREPMTELRLALPYPMLGPLEGVVQRAEGTFVEKRFAEVVTVVVSVPERRSAELRRELDELGLNDEAAG